MSEQTNLGRPEEREGSGLLLSVEPLRAGAELNADADSDKSDALGGDESGERNHLLRGRGGGTDEAGDSDGSDLLGGDSDASDAKGGDSDGTDLLGGDSDRSDRVDAGGSDR